MIKVLGTLAFCLLVSPTATADPIVTWYAEGEIGLATAFGIENHPVVPPVGTPVQLTLTLHRDLMTPTPLSAAGDNCFSVPVSGTLTIGGAAHSLSGAGFTHAQLPGSNCSPSWHETQFLLGLGEPSTPTPWLIADGFMEMWYTDMLVRDAFPDIPNASAAGFQLREQSGRDWLVGGVVNWKNDVQQTAPVPEPGTMALFALGLAGVARRVRRRTCEHPPTRVDTETDSGIIGPVRGGV